MNRFVYEEIQIGWEQSLTVVITQEMQDSFCKLTGDINPLHIDKNFVTTRKEKYLGVVVYGMLAASFCSTLAGVYLPGENCLLHSVETNFIKPIYIGDTLTIKGTVKAKNDYGSQLVIKAIFKNQNKEIVLRGIIKAGCLK